MAESTEGIPEALKSPLDKMVEAELNKIWNVITSNQTELAPEYRAILYENYRKYYRR